jgi:hypothetical protein
MSRTKRKPSTPQPTPSSKPQLPLAVHESVAEIEKRTKRLLEGCRPFPLSFSVSKGTEVLRTCAVDAFDRRADYYTSLKTLVPQWPDEIAEQTVTATLDLVDMFDLDWQTRPAVEQELRRTGPDPGFRE